MKHSLWQFFMILLFAGCAARVTVNLDADKEPLDYRQEIVVLQLDDEVPPDAQLIGTVKVGDSGFTIQCDYPLVLEKAEMESRKAGGNLVKITEHQTPDLLSSCHRITAQIYYLENIDDVLEDFSAEEVYFDTAANYSLLHVYRLAGRGALVTYMVHLGDRDLCRATQGTYETIMITEEGQNELWAQTESKTTVPINIEHGKEYYLRCSVSMGFMVGRPSLVLVDKVTGKAEFDALQRKDQ